MAKLFSASPSMAFQSKVPPLDLMGDKRLAYPPLDSVEKTFDCVGILGLVDLCFAKYLVIATQKVLAATIQTHKVWRIVAGECVPIGVERPQHDEEALSKIIIDKEFLGHLSSLLNSGSIYFSSSYDLTHSLQHNQFLGRPEMHLRVDDRYLFNSHLRLPFAKKDLTSWTVKAIIGFAGSITIPNLDHNVVLISRTSTLRLGTRYLRRGLDDQGNAANSVEMEQIVFPTNFNDKHICSFVQIRGSVPAIWGQELDLSYKPRLFISKTSAAWESSLKHFEDLRRQYCGEDTLGGDEAVICVNLLDDKGFEESLSKEYEESVDRQKDKTIHYEPFPVTKWCKKMDYTNMEILVARVNTRMSDAGFFLAKGSVPSFASQGSLEVYEVQRGVMRVSCLDSLDRTNMTCTLFARSMLPQQIAFLENPRATKAVSDTEDYRKAIRPHVYLLTNLWADSGDSISILYAGTRALRSDIVRTGKRLFLRGALYDGINSLTRYYLNNFSDGQKQDTFDLLTGKVSSQQLYLLSKTQGREKANALVNPKLSPDQGIGRLLPSFVRDNVEPLLHYPLGLKLRAERHIAPDGQPQSYIGLFVSTVRKYAPRQVSNLIEFSAAMLVFVYILVCVKLFQIQGQFLVDRPRLVGLDPVSLD